MLDVLNSFRHNCVGLLSGPFFFELFAVSARTFGTFFCPKWFLGWFWSQRKLDATKRNGRDFEKGVGLLLKNLKLEKAQILGQKGGGTPGPSTLIVGMLLTPLLTV